MNPKFSGPSKIWLELCEEVIKHWEAVQVLAKPENNSHDDLAVKTYILRAFK